jgi:hypothetical protein
MFGVLPAYAAEPMSKKKLPKKARPIATLWIKGELALRMPNCFNKRMSMRSFSQKEERRKGREQHTFCKKIMIRDAIQANKPVTPRPRPALPAELRLGQEFGMV